MLLQARTNETGSKRYVCFPSVRDDIGGLACACKAYVTKVESSPAVVTLTHPKHRCNQHTQVEPGGPHQSPPPKATTGCWHGPLTVKVSGLRSLVKRLYSDIHQRLQLLTTSAHSALVAASGGSLFLLQQLINRQHPTPEALHQRQAPRNSRVGKELIPYGLPVVPSGHV